jgi:hypothetical protein
MKHENLFKIYIPEPCHEEWEKMTPNKQGAFCSSCSKTVVDFSNKSDKEIEEYLLDNLDKKICGRFKAVQVDEMPRLKIEAPKIHFPRYLFPLSYSPVRAFAMALFVVASVAIAGCSASDGSFSGEKDEQQIERRHTGAVEYKPDTNAVRNNNNTDTTDQKAQLNFNQQLMGGVSVNWAKNHDSTAVKIDTTQEIRMLGEVYIKPDTTKEINSNQDTLKTNENPKYKTGMINKVENKEKKEYLKGDVYIKQ